jgi:hypothetical protein
MATTELFYPWYNKGIINRDRLLSSLRISNDEIEINKLELLRLYSDLETEFSRLENYNKNNSIVYVNIGGNCEDNCNQDIITMECLDCMSRNQPSFLDTENTEYQYLYIYIDNFPDIDSPLRNILTINTFELIDKNTWITQDNKKIICVYNTYMPTFLDIGNSLYSDRTIIDQLKERQQIDKQFVTNFYDKLSTFISHTKYTVVLSSVIYQNTIQFGTLNYAFDFFPELPELLTKNKNLLILLMKYLGSQHFYILRKKNFINYRNLEASFVEDENGTVKLVTQGNIELSNHYDDSKTEEKMYKIHLSVFADLFYTPGSLYYNQNTLIER